MTRKNKFVPFRGDDLTIGKIAKIQDELNLNSRSDAIRLSLEFSSSDITSLKKFKNEKLIL